MKLVAYIFRGIIRAYQLVITPILPGACRYHPTCSQYALEALERFGVFQGLWLALKRILRCHPWAGYGIDPVPDQPEASSVRQFSPHQ
ncbi:MAG: membrane protein insertion efficiency factor YidD [Rhodospirillales bacterium]